LPSRAAVDRRRATRASSAPGAGGGDPAIIDLRGFFQPFSDCCPGPAHRCFARPHLAARMIDVTVFVTSLVYTDEKTRFWERHRPDHG
jgi:hypothetical protein